MIGKLITAIAGRSIARNVGGTAAGPVGAAAAVVVPFLVPKLARALGPLGMAGAAVGGLLFTRYLSQQKKKQEALNPTIDGKVVSRTPTQPVVPPKTY